MNLNKNLAEDLVSNLKRQFVEAGIVEPQWRLPSVWPPLFYQSAGRKIWYRSQNDTFQHVTLSDFESAVAAVGVTLPSSDEKRRDALKALQRELLANNCVDWAGVIAGNPVGVVEDDAGCRLLNVRAGRLIEPVKGDCDKLLNLVNNVLGQQVPQIEVFLSWLKIGVEDFMRSSKVGAWKANVRQSQVMIIAGPPGAGKTLLASLIKHLFGGGVAHPYQSFIGDTAFNEDLAESGLLVIDDEAASFHPLARRKFQQALKQWLVSDLRRIHAKGQKAVTLKTCQRVIILVNEDSLEVLPHLDGSFRDKVHLLKAFPSREVHQQRTTEERLEWSTALKAELPHFLWWLQHEFQIPESRVDARYGVVAYQDEELMDEICQTDENAVLMEQIEAILACSSETRQERPNKAFTLEANRAWTWQGTAHELEDMLRENLRDAIAQRLFPHNNSLGLRLESLSQQFPLKVLRLKRVSGLRRWSINMNVDEDRLKRLKVVFRAITPCPA